jgi:hypothetical protein
MYAVVPIEQDALNLMESKNSSHLPFLTGLAALVNVFATIELNVGIANLLHFFNDLQFS